MNGVKTYLLTVTAGALVCALVQEVAGGKGTAGKVLSLCCGVFLLLCAFSPLLHLEVPESIDIWGDYTTQANGIVDRTSLAVREQTSMVIAQRSEAYILDKAQGMGADVRVQVELGEDGVPCFVRLQGQVTPFIRKKLAWVIESDLGIPVGQQRWSGA